MRKTLFEACYWSRLVWSWETSASHALSLGSSHGLSGSGHANLFSGSASPNKRNKLPKALASARELPKGMFSLKGEKKFEEMQKASQESLREKWGSNLDGSQLLKKTAQVKLPEAVSSPETPAPTPKEIDAHNSKTFVSSTSLSSAPQAAIHPSFNLSPPPVPQAQPSSSSDSPPESTALSGASSLSLDESLRLDQVPEDIFVVDSGEKAHWVVEELMRLKDIPCTNLPFPLPETRHHSQLDQTRYFACDTEVTDIEVKEQSPVGHGAVICFSIYAGPDVDFNRGQFKSPNHDQKQDRIWVDVWNEIETYVDNTGRIRPVMLTGGKVKLKDHRPILDAFKIFFEDAEAKKAWHNYGFDRHVLANMGIECQGFGADTLHMARLLDASRRGKKNYGLDSLTDEKDGFMSFLRAPPVKLSPLEKSGWAKANKKKARGSSEDVEAAPLAMDPSPNDGIKAKISMKKLFGQAVAKKDGTPGKTLELPPMHELQLGADGGGRRYNWWRPTWINYSALDAKATWQLREALYRGLKQWPWTMQHHLSNVMGVTHKSLYEFYQEYWVEFGKVLTDMEREGMPIDREHLRLAEKQAIEDRDKNIKLFVDWAQTMVPAARDMNVASGAQIRQLLFPEYAGVIAKPKKTPAASPTASVDDEEGGGLKKAASKRKVKEKEVIGEGCRSFKMSDDEYAVKYKEYEERLAMYEGEVMALIEAGSPKNKIKERLAEKGIVKPEKPKKNKEVILHGIWGPGVKGKLKPDELTATNAAPVSIKVLRSLAGKGGAARKALDQMLKEEELDNLPPTTLADELDEIEQNLPNRLVSDEEEGEETEEVVGQEGKGKADDDDDLSPEAEKERVRAVADALKDQLEAEAKTKGYGKLYAAMGGGIPGLKACAAVEALCEVNAIDKLLSAFIKPLQSDNISTTDENGRTRIHCSLNINTETGRLSARRPNLQNQPALEKDRYKVRKAFKVAEGSGNTLIVADYGQLELRILAHMASCKSMINAFVLGGDFHSRTAYGMYDHIQKAVKEGECYLEWEGTGEPDKPLLKDKFAAERRKAKILNFSIAYGKTAHGLAKDFNTSLPEAEETVNKWYSDRFEVRQWQEMTKKEAVSTNKDKSPNGKVAFVTTLLGRNRPLPDLESPDWRKRGHAERAAINTPIQGSAADVAASAMVAISKCDELKSLGFRLLMQVHDEVILEGPEASKDKARQLVIAHMANPWNSEIKLAIQERRRPVELKDENFPKREDGSPLPVEPLLVELSTDSNCAPSWYEAK